MTIKDRPTTQRPAERPTPLVTVVPPRLENGDRLTRREFERRYAAMPRLNKAELIEGVVHMPSPVRLKSHAVPHAHIMTWLGYYCSTTTGVKLADNATVRLDADNEYQPDALLRIEPTVGGQTRISDDDYLEGPPELIVEVAASSAAIDLHTKLNVCRRVGVLEYVVWAVYDRQIVWFQLAEGDYAPLAPDAVGVIHSRAFPGLSLAVPQLLAEDLAGVLAQLQQSLALPEHAAFVAHLSSTSA
jgi:Uma2 family endonuclease